jgi:hypothetical protein
MTVAETSPVSSATLLPLGNGSHMPPRRPVCFSKPVDGLADSSVTPRSPRNRRTISPLSVPAAPFGHHATVLASVKRP